MALDVKLIKQLREETGSSFSDVKNALVDSKGDLEKAREWLKKRGFEKAEKKTDRETSQGLVEAYIHQNGKIGSVVTIVCETDFVARTEDFKTLAHEIAMQIAAMNPKNVDILLKQEYIRDNSQTIGDLVKQAIGKLGENIKIKEIARFEV